MRYQHDSFYDSAKWHKLRDSVLRRDKYTDQVQKRYSMVPVEATLVHHIFPREYFPEFEYERWNLISVSARTHSKLHGFDKSTLSHQGMELLEQTAREYQIDLEPYAKRLARLKGTPPR